MITRLKEGRDSTTINKLSNMDLKHGDIYIENIFVIQNAYTGTLWNVLDAYIKGADGGYLYITYLYPITRYESNE